jgi:hypothetical protein
VVARGEGKDSGVMVEEDWRRKGDDKTTSFLFCQGTFISLDFILDYSRQMTDHGFAFIIYYLSMLSSTL